MKSLFVFIGLMTFLFSKETYSQEISSKELIGTWDKRDTAKGNFSFKFIDASNLIIKNSKNGSYNLTYKLIADSIKGKSILLMEFNTDGIKRFNNYLLESINVNTLRFVNLDSYNGVVQKPSEINNETFYLIRRNS